MRFDPKIARRILDVVEKGGFPRAAARAEGIPFDVLDGWVAQGEADLESSGRRSKLAKFVGELRRAEAKAEAEAVEAWQANMAKDWRAAKEFLARRFPSRWGSKKGQASTGTHRDVVVDRDEVEERMPPEQSPPGKSLDPSSFFRDPIDRIKNHLN